MLNSTLLRLTFGLVLLALLAAACTPTARQQQVDPRQNSAEAQRAREARLNARPPINTDRNLYEGSLWRGAASWGNLLRDHRARFRGDLLTVTDLQRIVNVPEPDQQQQQQQQQQGEGDGQNGQQQTLVDPVLAFLREQERIRDEIDREQNEILRSLDQMEVEVVRVLANGNMVVRGVHPPIYRDRNRVKYVVTLEGIVRPSDVDNNNTVTASRISKAELRIRRFVKREQLPVSSVARAAGQDQAAGVIDRITDLATAPPTGSRDTVVSPR